MRKVETQGQNHRISLRSKEGLEKFPAAEKYPRRLFFGDETPRSRGPYRHKPGKKIRGAAKKEQQTHILVPNNMNHNQGQFHKTLRHNKGELRKPETKKKQPRDLRSQAEAKNGLETKRTRTI